MSANSLALRQADKAHCTHRHGGYAILGASCARLDTEDGDSSHRKRCGKGVIAEDDAIPRCQTNVRAVR